MTQTIKEQQRLGVLLLGAIFFSLVLYIYMLNFSISESYRKERLIKEARLTQQDMQSREEFLITRLQEFYDSHASSFVSGEGEPQFVSRTTGVARIPRSSTTAQ